MNARQRIEARRVAFNATKVEEANASLAKHEEERHSRAEEKEEEKEPESIFSPAFVAEVMKECGLDYATTYRAIAAVEKIAGEWAKEGKSPLDRHH